MRGLLLKDWYMAAKYCRSYLLIITVFFVTSIFGENPLFFMFYPMMLAAMVPVTLISYDERSRWNAFSCALPYSKAQLVSVKYVGTLLLLGAATLLSALVLGLRMARLGSFDGPYLFGTLGLLASAGLLAPALLLPIIFRFGVEKGRIVYYAVIGVVCGLTAFASMSARDLPLDFRPEALALLLFPVAACVFAASWLLSARLYRMRTL